MDTNKKEISTSSDENNANDNEDGKIKNIKSKKNRSWEKLVVMWS